MTARIDVRAGQLVPGDVVEDVGTLSRVVVVAVVRPHPLYRNLVMVIWSTYDGELHLDAVNPAYVVGRLVRSGDDLRPHILGRHWTAVSH